MVISKNYNALSFPIWFKIITLIHNGKNNKSKIYKETSFSYDYIQRITDEMDKRELLRRKKKGRIIVLTLTEKGKELVKLINRIMINSQSQSKR